MLGRAVLFTRVVTQDDFDRFARLSGDDNPIHVDREFSARTRWGRTLCHGMLLYALVAHVVTTRLVAGSVELEQDLVFPGPIYAGDEVTVRAEIVRIDRALGHVEVRTRISRAADEIGCEGRTLVSADV
jgi:acyl dehydratase